MGLRLLTTDYEFGESVNRIIGELTAQLDYTIIQLSDSTIV